MQEKIISQGAEAILVLKDDKILKKRIQKSYRHVELDNKIRLNRTKREIKVMNKLKELKINVPKIYESDDKFTICMDFIDGKRLRDVLIEDTSKKIYLKKVGNWLAKMHENGIIHGDLTTSNILVDKSEKLYLIDFGLSLFSKKIEDMAVDIHLLKQAIESTHYKNVTEFYKEFLKGYKFEDSEKVLKRLETVELRGRNKH
ncbi:MAG: KEOPS complex kinase/ATPase Bud32 [Candidatus Woesearchaeota archaeon]